MLVEGVGEIHEITRGLQAITSLPGRQPPYRESLKKSTDPQFLEPYAHQCPFCFEGTCQAPPQREQRDDRHWNAATTEWPDFVPKERKRNRRERVNEVPCC
jgi:hypothetical protein